MTYIPVNRDEINEYLRYHIDMLYSTMTGDYFPYEKSELIVIIANSLTNGVVEGVITFDQAWNLTFRFVREMYESPFVNSPSNETKLA